MRTRTPDLDDQLDRLEGICPAYLAKPIHFLRAPGLRWLRTTAGILLIIGSFFWFLPILGLEMFPIGLILIAIDVPFLRGPVARMIAWGEQAVMGMLSAVVAVWRRYSGIGPMFGAVFGVLVVAAGFVAVVFLVLHWAAPSTN